MEKRDDNYWEQKIRLFLHDPIDKALKVPGHERRAGHIADALGVSTPDKSEVVLMDIIAAGLDRANLPGYSDDKSKNGAINFSESPKITHPISGGEALKFSGNLESADVTTNQIVGFVREDTDRLDTVWDKKTFFNYLFFALRKRIITENCGMLGHFWNRIPADSRIPDHSIWNHAGMVSALATSFAESDSKTASLVVFSISPVQVFIGKTRKLRDHWAASVILSWLAFEGIAAVMEFLGPDHVIYPSLQDQPLVETHLTKDFSKIFDAYEQASGLKKDATVASLPNKFVFLSPSGNEEDFIAEIENRIKAKWEELSNIVRGFIGEKRTHVEAIFRRQTQKWWQFSWSCAHLLSLSHRGDMEQLFGKEKFSDLFETVRKFSENYPNADIVYPASHALVQTALAASKSRAFSVRDPEPGVKCPVCGEFEILHDLNSSQTAGAGAYGTAADVFWNGLHERFGNSTVKTDERLCAICSIKRFTPEAIKNYEKDHPLRSIFTNSKFPSTTEMATWEYRQKMKRAGITISSVLEQKLVDGLHDADERNAEPDNEIETLVRQAKDVGITLAEEDKYYAILMMDGDKIGDLVNGTTIAAKWRDVLHPELADKYEKGALKAKWPLWKDYLKKQRILSPALHATISESLGAFSLYAVPSIVKKYNGKLIYAGGDDVAAVLPLSSALDAASAIKRAYNYRFAKITEDGIEEIQHEDDGRSPVFPLLGAGALISISAAIFICHHKQPLRGALEETHHLLENVAKNKSDRNAFAIRLKKRSGHVRDFTAQWHEENVFLGDESGSLMASLAEVQDAHDSGALSSSFIYRVPQLGEMILEVLTPIEKPAAKEVEQIIRILKYEILHSGNFNKIYPGKQNKSKREAAARRLAAHIAGVTARWDKNAGDKGAWEYQGEVPVIARYLAKGGAQQ